MFENENEKVITKAKSQAVSKARQVSTRPSGPGAVQSSSVTAERNNSSSTLLTSTQSFAPTTEEQAIGFFFSNLIVSVFEPSQDYLVYIPTLSNKNNIDKHLFTSIRAVGLAGFSNIANSSLLMKEARKDYSTVLHLVNAALQSLTDASKDSTLLAVMILSIFKTVTGSSHRSLHAWAQHIHSAAALVKLCSPAQLCSPQGLCLFNQVTSSLLMTCVHCELEIPAAIQELHTEAAKYIDMSNPA
jgi:hypothetical protein